MPPARWAWTQPTVGRHVAALERALGVVLFTRSQVGLLPTEVALALRTHAEAMESTAASLERTAMSQGEGVRGRSARVGERSHQRGGTATDRCASTCGTPKSRSRACADRPSAGSLAARS